jgi:hypothetical protein
MKKRMGERFNEEEKGEFSPAEPQINPEQPTSPSV